MVITGNDASRLECPLILRTQKSIYAFCTSAMGHKATSPFRTFSDRSASGRGHELRNIVPIEISQKSVRGGIGKF